MCKKPREEWLDRGHYYGQILDDVIALAKLQAYNGIKE
jgi:hypothetical protein